MSSRKRKILCLEERVKVLKLCERGESCRKVASDFGVGKTQIQAIMKNKDEIMKHWDGGVAGERKILTARRCAYGDLNEKVYAWFCSARAKNLPVSGKLLQEKALLYSVEMNHDDYSASNGWLYRFQKRYNIKCSVLSGEGADVSSEVVEDWEKRLSHMCEGYALKDIFNADETGLFYRALPSRSLVAKGDMCKGGKQGKERMTVLLCASATGEKVRPLVIGK